MIPSSTPIDLDDYARNSLSKDKPMHFIENIGAGFASPFIGLARLGQSVGLIPENKNLDAFVNALNADNQSGFFSMSNAANMIGFSLNPISWVTATLGGAASGAALKGITNGIMNGAARVMPVEAIAADIVASRPIQSLIGFELPKFAQQASIRSLGNAGAVNFGAWAGAIVPAELANEYDQDTGHIHWGGVAKGAMIGGGAGLLLGSLPFGAGMLWGKIRGVAKTEPFVTPHPGESTSTNLVEISNALSEGRISAKEAKLFEDYLQNPNDKSLNGRFNEFLSKNGQQVDSVNSHVEMPILNDKDINSLQVAMANQLSTDLGGAQKTALTDFIMSNKLDEWRSNPNMRAGIRGSIDFINRKLDKMPEQLVKINKIAKTYLKENIRKKHPFSQDNLYKLVKSRNLDTKRTVYTIPKDVEKRVKAEKEIKKEEQRLNDLKKIEAKETPTYHHGHNLKEDLDLPFEVTTHADKEFGHGYWATPELEVAQAYGKRIESIKGKYKIFNVNKSTDSELLNLYKIVEKTKLPPQSRGLKFYTDAQIKKAKDAVEAFRNAVKRKGYEGIERVEWESGKPEIMFFEKPQERISNKKIARSEEKLNRLKEKVRPLLSPKEEIEKLESSLIKDGKLIDKMEHSNAYNRLLDLSRMSDKARGLLYKVNLIREYEKQTAYRDLLEIIQKIIDSDIKPTISTESIERFMKERIARNNSKRELPEMKEIERKANETDSALEQTIKDAQNEIDRVEAKELKKEFGVYADKIKQFKESPNIFKNLISCVLGAANG